MITLLSTSYKIIANIYLEIISPFANTIRREYHCRFRRTTYLALSNYFSRNGNSIMRQDFKNAYDSIKRKSLYDIPIKLNITE